MRNLSLTLFILLFLITACMDQTTKEIPANIASLDDQIEIDSVIHEIQSIMRDLGYHKNLSDIPIIVTDSLSGDGRCILSVENSAILINKNLFLYEDLDPQLNQISRLWSVLLHEIGHCFFHRSHEEKSIPAYDGFLFQFKYKIKAPNSYYCYHHHRALWPGSVMGKNGLPIVPESLKQFYVKELIENTSHFSAEDILRFSEIQMTSVVNASSTSETVNCY